MTTPPILSITDELIAELDEFVSTPIMFASTVMPIQDAMRALLAERAELKRDAERYRWLRESMWYVGRDQFYCGEGGDMQNYTNENYNQENLDAAIDAAMQS